MEFISTCAAGLEELIIAEIADFGGVVVEHHRGAVRWSGTLEHGYRACLWSRFSSRVILSLKTYEISGDSDLYEGVTALDWNDHLSVQSSFAVDCVLSGEGPVTNSMYGALRVKDGIVDQFRQASGQRPSVKVDQPDLQVYVHINATSVMLGLDLSGVPLHRRGYRMAAGPAPLKESLAAAIIKLSGWDGKVRLLDPMCGSGTLLIEAALMFGDSAPGLGRPYFGLFGWRGHRPEIWETLVEEAIEKEDNEHDKNWPDLVGFDGDEAAVEAARKNIVRAGLENRIRVSCQDLSKLENNFSQTGHIISNPPYGERLSDKQSVKYLYRYLGSRFQKDFADWRISMFTATPDFADQFRIDSTSSLKIFNGPLPCRLINGEPKHLRVDPGVDTNHAGWQIDTGDRVQDDELSNRIIKNFKQIQSWAKKHKQECYRVYDRDLPQYNVSIDLLGSLILITEFSASNKVDQRAVDERFNHALRCVRSLFQVGRERVFVNRRLNRDRAKGKIKQQTIEVVENNAVLLSELPSRSDTGFSVDQVLVRRFISSRIGRGRFLCMFDGAGSATVAAALGGSTMTTTITGSTAESLSMKMNFNRNGIDLSKHHIVQKTPVSWLKDNKQLYDLMYINPRQRVYFKGKSNMCDVVEDLRFIIDRAMGSLAADGILIFSTMVPSLRLDPIFKEKYQCTDLSREMSGALLPKRKQHFNCWQIEHLDKPTV